MKECKHHGMTEFVFENRGSYRCKRCRTEAVVKRRKKVKSLLVEYKGAKCEICGYDKCQDALDFHHIDVNTKKFGLSSRGLTRSLVSMKIEVDKCSLVCANCHREIHSNQKRKTT